MRAGVWAACVVLMMYECHGSNFGNCLNALRCVLEVFETQESMCMKKRVTDLEKKLKKAAPLFFAEQGDLFDVCMTNHHPAMEGSVVVRNQTFVFQEHDEEKKTFRLTLHPHENILTHNITKRTWYKCAETWQVFDDMLCDVENIPTDVVEAGYFHSSFDLSEITVAERAAGLFKKTSEEKKSELHENSDIYKSIEQARARIYDAIDDHF